MNLVKWTSFFTVISLIVICLSGCWDSREITDLGVVTTVWIDKGDVPGTVKVGAQINQGKSSESSSGIALANIANINYYMAGESVFDCFKQLEIESTYSLYLQHNQAIIISSSLAEEGLTEYLDYFLREHQGRPDVWLFIAEGTAEDVIHADIEQEDNVAIALSSLMYKKDKISSYWGVLMLSYYESLLKESKAVLVPIISVVHEHDHDTYAVNEMAIMQHDRMIGKLSDDEILGYNWLLGNVDEGRLSSKSERGEVTFKTSSETSKIAPRFLSETELVLDVYITTDIFTVDIFSYENMNIGEIDALIELDAKNEINRLARNTLTKAQSMSADIYGFGNYIYTHYPERWASIKGDWPEIFKNMQVNIIIDVKMPYNLKFNAPIDIKELLDYGKTT